jgi:hypothetical protein
MIIMIILCDIFCIIINYNIIDIIIYDNINNIDIIIYNYYLLSFSKKLNL